MASDHETIARRQIPVEGPAVPRTLAKGWRIRFDVHCSFPIHVMVTDLSELLWRLTRAQGIEVEDLCTGGKAILHQGVARHLMLRATMKMLAGESMRTY